MSFRRLSPQISIYEIVFRFCNNVCLLLHEIIFNNFLKKFSVVLFAYLIKEDVRNVLLLYICTHALRHWHDPLIHIRGFDAWAFTFGLHLE